MGLSCTSLLYVIDRGVVLDKLCLFMLSRIPVRVGDDPRSGMNNAIPHRLRPVSFMFFQTLSWVFRNPHITRPGVVQVSRVIDVIEQIRERPPCPSPSC